MQDSTQLQTDTVSVLHDELVRVLVIEDNTPDVMLIAEALRERHVKFKLTHVTDGEQALATLSGNHTNPEQFHLIVLDLNMPRLGGLEVLSTIRSNPSFKTTPVVVLTSSLSPREEQEAHRLGADKYIRKPSDLDEFFSEVGGAIREAAAKHPLTEARGAV